MVVPYRAHAVTRRSHIRLPVPLAACIAARGAAIAAARACTVSDVGFARQHTPYTPQRYSAPCTRKSSHPCSVPSHTGDVPQLCTCMCPGSTRRTRDAIVTMHRRSSHTRAAHAPSCASWRLCTRRQHTPYTCRHRHSAQSHARAHIRAARATRGMIRAAAHTHRGLARVPVVPYRAHAVSGRLATCIAARGAAIAAARARTVSDGGFVRAVSTRRTRAANVIVPRSAHAGAHIRAARIFRGMIRAAAHTHRGLARVPVVPYRAHAVGGRP